MTITRRDALRGVGVASAAIAVPAVAIAVVATKDQDSDARLKETVARWHRAYEDFKQAYRFDEAHPEAGDEFNARGYGDAWPAMSAVHEELSGMHPKTLAGVVALLCCAETIEVDKWRNRRGAEDGPRVPKAVFHMQIHGDRMQQNATAALGRLAGVAWS